MRELGEVECPRYGYYRLVVADGDDAETDDPANIQGRDGEARQ
jgi:hypothetical protein